MKRMKRLSYFLVFALLMTTLLSGTSVFAVPIGQPTITQITVVDYPQDPGVRVTWSGSGSSGYDVYRDGTKINSNAIYIGSYTDKDLSLVQGSKYTYRVVYKGNTMLYDEDMYAPTLLPMTKLESVNASVAGTNNDALKISWNKVSGLDVKIFAGTASDLDIKNDKYIAKVSASAGAYQINNLKNETTYTYKLLLANKYGNSSAGYVEVSAKTGAKPAGGSGGSGGGGGGGSTSSITDIVAPSVKSAKVEQSYTAMGKANIGGTINYGKYKEDGYDRTCYDTKVELLDGSKVIGSVSSSSGYFFFNNITVPYGKYKTFTVKVSSTINGNVYSGTKKLKARSKQMKKIKGVRVTKISAKRAVVRWSSVDGATSYRIYKGKKKVKEVKSRVTKCTVKGKGAGKAKYKVVPVRKSEGKKYAGKGATAKPKSNVYITANTGAVNSWNVKASFVVKKVSLSGRTYTVTGWGKNYAMYIKLKKFKSIKITVYCDGKIVAKKTIKNKRMNLNPQRSKKMTFKIKGKAGADLRHGFTNVSVRCTCDPVTLNP